MSTFSTQRFSEKANLYGGSHKSHASYRRTQSSVLKKSKLRIFSQVATKIFNFLYGSLLTLKQLFTILKLFQRSSFKRNIILLEITQSKQNPSLIEFLLASY